MGLFSMVVRVFEEVAERAENVLCDDSCVKAELTEIYMELDAGTLTEEEFGRREAELVQRLEVIEAYKQQRSNRAGR